MVNKPTSFEIVHTRKWKSDRQFQVWVADGAFNGAQLNQAGAGPWVESGLELAVIGEGIWGLVILLVSLPFALLLSTLLNRKKRAVKQQIDALEPASHEHLTWDRCNFRLNASEITSAQFREKRAGFLPPTTTQNLEIRAINGELWLFRLNSRLEADQLKRELNEGGIPATWRENG